MVAIAVILKSMDGSWFRNGGQAGRVGTRHNLWPPARSIEVAAYFEAREDGSWGECPASVPGPGMATRGFACNPLN